MSESQVEIIKDALGVTEKILQHLFNEIKILQAQVTLLEVKVKRLEEIEELHHD